MLGGGLLTPQMPFFVKFTIQRFFNMEPLSLLRCIPIRMMTSPERLSG
jgi:hypothetical protein